MGKELQIADFDYVLPEELIAQEPCPERDQARLLVIHRTSRQFFDHHVSDLPKLLRAGDLLVLNNSKVIPARLFGRRAATGGRWEGLFLREDEQGVGEFLSHTRGYLRAGEWVELFDRDGKESRIRLQVVGRSPEKHLFIRTEAPHRILGILELLGHVPIPPYIRKGIDAEGDRERYQTVFSSAPGSIAAPTAGLHFTDSLFQQLTATGVLQAYVTLHVGIGTFQPMKVQSLGDHRMHKEWCEVPHDTARQIRETHEGGGRVIAVGTTTARTLESARLLRQQGDGAWRGWSDVFIRSADQFQLIDGLFTNFHLPKSTLLVLVCAFAGRELVLRAYEHAIQNRYRFYSYGDAMLIL